MQIVIRMNSPIVSILMPIYNEANTLIQTINSIQLQSLTDFEVIAINDGSEDNTQTILKQFSSTDKRIKISDLPRVGIIKALNHGLKQCKGKYIARMDADDLMHPKRLEIQVNHMQSNPDISVTSSLVESFPNKSSNTGFQRYVDWLNSLITDDLITNNIFVESPLPHPSTMLRTKELIQLGGYKDNGWAEDYDLWLRYFSNGKRMDKIPYTLLSWRDHPTRTSRTDSRYSVENFIRAKVYYLSKQILTSRDHILIWGAGQMGKRISKHLLRNDMPINCFFDINPHKIGKTLRNKPIYNVNDLPKTFIKYKHPILLVAVASNNARSLIRRQLNTWGFTESIDYWCVA